ncbi:SH3 domain-containing protein [Roseovarius sp. S4756]|uniref:SH3 domain-containing protein n=1 Tax=Roseovarius maritimus TaxID=3342637 RepID=UPI00372AE71E
MRNAIFTALGALAVGALAGCDSRGLSGQDGPPGYYEVAGVETGDMLKLRAGPGTGFDVIVGVPNGSVLWISDCERTGGTRWCKATMKEGRSLDGYVSWAYLRPL